MVRQGIADIGSSRVSPFWAGIIALVLSGPGGSPVWPVLARGEEEPDCEAVLRPGSYIPGHTACRVDARIMLAREEQGGIRIHIQARRGAAGLVRGGRCEVVCKERTIKGWEEAGGMRSLFFTYVECTTLRDRCLGKGHRGIKSTEVRYYPFVDLPSGSWGTCAGNPGGPGSLLLLTLRADRAAYDLRAFSPERPGEKISARVSRCHDMAPAEKEARR